VTHLDRPGEAPAAVRIMIIAPLDPDRMPIGGIASFVRGFVKFAPHDLELEIVGTSANAPLGAWRTTQLESRTIRHLPVARSRERRGGFPIAATFTLGLMRYGRRIPPGRVIQLHRPGTALPLLGRTDPMTHVVHLPADALTSSASESNWRRLAFALRIVERRVLRRMARTYVVNEEQAIAYRETYPEFAARISYIPNWVDDDVFGPPDAAARERVRADLRADLGVGEHDRVLVFAGRLESQKNPLLLVRGFAAARHAWNTSQQAGDLHLVIVGDGNLRADVTREVAALDVASGVSILGSIGRDRLATLMGGADALVITSAFEAGPTVGLEALASGLPVVTTPVGTVGRVVAGDDCGAIIQPVTGDGVARAIARTLARDPGEIGAAAIRAVAPYRARAVLPQLYEDARRLARG
jgi:glycosyltransferase involved in cell wall biosynthesis